MPVRRLLRAALALSLPAVPVSSALAEPGTPPTAEERAAQPDAGAVRNVLPPGSRGNYTAVDIARLRTTGELGGRALPAVRGLRLLGRQRRLGGVLALLGPDGALVAVRLRHACRAHGISALASPLASVTTASALDTLSGQVPPSTLMSAVELGDPSPEALCAAGFAVALGLVREGAPSLVLVLEPGKAR